MKQTKHFKRTAFLLSAKSMVGTLLLIIAMLVPQGAWAMDFISEVKYGVHSKQATAKGYLSGYTIIDHDFNNDTKGDWVYIGYKTSTNAKDAITGLLVVTNDTESNSSTYGDSGFKAGGAKTMMVDGKRYYLAEWGGYADMNHGNKTHKNPVYLYYTKDGNTTNGAQLITTLSAHRGELTANPAGLSVVPLYGGNGAATNGTYSLSKLSDFGDTNKGGGGSYNYITYTAHTHSFTNVQTTPATCVGDGLRKSTCSCGVIEEELPKDPNAHNYNEYGLCNNNYEHFQAPTGEGTANSPYLVKNIGNLYWLSDQVAKTSNNSFHARQDNDIKALNNHWNYSVTIGCTYNNVDHPFKGTYDGGGYIIKGLSYSQRANVKCVAKGLLFGLIENATIKNVGIVNAEYASGEETQRNAILCGNATNSTISNCFVVGTTCQYIKGYSIGAICGLCSSSTISGCYSSDDTECLIGMITSKSTFTGCYSTQNQIQYVGSTYSSSIDYHVISVDDIASGSLCYTMNGEQTNGTQTWYQNLGSGAEGFPRPQKNTAYTVYKVTGYKCDGVTQKEGNCYSNSNTPVRDTHTLTEHAAKSPTSCADAGNYKYYTCSQTCCSDKYYKDNGSHTTNTYENKDATLWRKPHTFAASDLTQDECTVCHHGFFRYTSVDNVVYEPRRPSNLKGADGNSLEILYNTNVEGKGVMEFNKPLVIIDSYALCYVIIGMEFSGELIIPNTVITIGDEAFSLHENITKLTIGNSVRTIGEQAFRYCKNLTGNLTIPNSVESIGKSAFYGCQKLNGKLTISNSVKTIDKDAFGYCTGLTSVEMQSVPQIGEYAFDYVTGNKTLVLSDDSYVYTGNNPDFPGMNKVTYTRKGIKNQWGTIVVPFAVNGSGNDYDLYTITRVSADKLSLTPVEGTLAAGTPAVICLKEGLAGNYDLTLTAANNAVNTAGSLQGSSADGLQLAGAYEATQLTANDYFIANNKFWRAGDMSAPVKAAPFRAYLKNTTGSAKASALNIAVEDDSATAIDVLNMLNDTDAQYYDLNGRRIPQLQKGINIVKMGNGKTVKVSIK